ncbi:MAG: A/G-specific adenine glycosylase [Methanomicrobiales archaeon]|jgi:A/G-specific adenine glycosylase
MDRERDIQRELSAMEESIRARYRSDGLTTGLVRLFQKFLMLFYNSCGRDLPWRRTTDPYRILVSEFMLQQTQVERVLVKYPEFLGRFPDIEVLARAPRHEVLLAWQGLGYNRRALSLHETARRVVDEYHGSVPLDRTLLDSLPGIGGATAGAIVVFSTNRPEIFIETNIRRVYIHLFFPDAVKVHDREIEPILGKTMIKKQPREFYYALMDYGSALKKGIGDPNGSLLKRGAMNPNTRSASYSRQSTFQGSDRQVRGILLRHLLAGNGAREEELRDLARVEPGRLERILKGLERDGFIERSGGRIRC